MDERLKLYEKLTLRYSEEFDDDDNEEFPKKEKNNEKENESLNEDALKQFRILFQINGKQSAETATAESAQKAMEIVKSKFNGQTLTNMRADPTFKDNSQQNQQQLNSSVDIKNKLNALVESIDLDSAEDNDITCLIIEAMKKELDMSTFYNNALMTLKSYNSNEIADVIHEFIREQSARVGKLEALFSVATGDSNIIDKGREEVESRDLDGNIVQPTDIEYCRHDDDFNYNAGFGFYF